MIKKKIYLFFALFFLIASFANAQEDFNLISDAQINLCPCSNQAYNILLQNTGSASSTYQIRSDGAASGWVTATPSELTLNPATAANILVYVNSPCSIKEKFDLKTFVASANGLTKSISQDLNFLACYDYSIGLGQIQDFKEDMKSVSFEEHENGYEACEEVKKIIPILIENKEDYGNIYDISLIGEEWSKLNANEFPLEGKQKGILLLILEPPKGSEREYKLRLDAITRLGQLKKSADIDLKVEKCYALSLDIKKERDSLCGEDKKEYDVEIKNDGKFAETLDLSIEGPGFISFENITALKLNTNQQKTISLEANPSAADSGNFNVKVTASNDKIKAEDAINLDVTEKNACYRANIEFKDTIKNYYAHEVFPVYIFNDGIREAAYKLSLEGPSWASITPNNLQLNPKQRGNVNLDLNPEEDASEGYYSIIIKAESNNEAYSKTINVSLKKENPLFKKIKATIGFYRYYFYLLAALIILIIIFWRLIQRRIRKIKEKYAKHKEKKEKQRALKEAREQREKEIRKKKEEEKERKEEEKRKKIEEKKKAEKITKKKETGKFFAKLKPYLIAALILIFIGTLIFSGIYFKLFEKLPKKPYYALLEIIYGIYAYLYYILIGIAFVIILAFISNRITKKRKKQAKAEKKPKKESKKKLKFFEKTFARLAVLILIAIAILFYVYGRNLFSYIKNFVVLYLYYFVVGILILIILIVIIRFYKPVMNFLLEEDKKE